MPKLTDKPDYSKVNVLMPFEAYIDECIKNEKDVEGISIGEMIYPDKRAQFEVERANRIKEKVSEKGKAFYEGLKKEVAAQTADALKEQQKGKKFNSTNSTPPIAATTLASTLCISASTLSNKLRPFGKYFQECCLQQKTKTPRLFFDELLPIAIEAVRRSEDRDAGNIIIRTTKDLRELFYM
jgi:hypothetical protein